MHCPATSCSPTEQAVHSVMLLAEQLEQENEHPLHAPAAVMTKPLRHKVHVLSLEHVKQFLEQNLH